MQDQKKDSRLFKLYLILFLTSVGIYSNTFNHEFVLDDDLVFVQNRFVQNGVAGIPDIFAHGFLYGYNSKNDQSYRPVVLSSLAIEKSLFGSDPYTLHKLNVIYYGILCCLLLYFLHLSFRREKTSIAFWIALLFALHPIHTEVVANIKGRDEIFHALFLVSSFIFALKFVDEGRKNNLFLGLIFFSLALLSKETAITYILLLPLTLWTFRDVDIKKVVKTTAYFFGVLTLYFIVRSLVLDTITFEEKMSILNNSIVASETYTERLATTFLVFGNYIKLLVFPHPLSWDYSYPHFPVVSFSNAKVILIVLLSFAIGVWALVKIRSKNIFAYGVLFFLVSFSIVSNFFILIGSTLGERFLFFPSIAFCVIVVFALERLLKGVELKNKFILPIIILVVSAAYGFKTFNRNKDWKNAQTLFEADIESVPYSTRTTAAVGGVYIKLAEQSNIVAEKQHYYGKALTMLNKSIALLPSNSSAYYNLGVIYMAAGQDDVAKNNFEKTVELKPEFINAWNNLGVIHFRRKNYEEALTYFQRCLIINVNFQSAYANIGAVYHNLGQTSKAKEFYKKALQLNPNDASTQNNLRKL